jgi:broad-specificity NMP kinase
METVTIITGNQSTGKSTLANKITEGCKTFKVDANQLNDYDCFNGFDETVDFLVIENINDRNLLNRLIRKNQIIQQFPFRKYIPIKHMVLVTQISIDEI